MRRYLYRTGKGYPAINVVVGAVECAKFELYRMDAAPYEDEKREQNGDLPEFG